MEEPGTTILSSSRAAELGTVLIYDRLGVVKAVDYIIRSRLRRQKIVLMRWSYSTCVLAVEEEVVD